MFFLHVLFEYSDLVNLRICYSIPTSNHNVRCSACRCADVVCYSIPTSNHNLFRGIFIPLHVVCYSIPTSNHNPQSASSRAFLLYVILFLHQTTTCMRE